MDLRGLVLLLGIILIVETCFVVANGNLVFPVERRKARLGLSEMKARDQRRRGRLLSAVDLSLGGNSHPTETGFVLFFFFFLLILNLIIMNSETAFGFFFPFFFLLFWFLF